MTYKLRLLTTGAFGSLSRMEQSLALDVARHAGMRAALATADSAALAGAGAEAYYRSLVQPAAAQGLLDEAEDAAWARACANGAEAHDARVRAFLVAWRERARELTEADPLPFPAPADVPPAREMPSRLGAA